MIAPRKSHQRHDQNHPIPTPAQVRRHQRQIREGWTSRKTNQRAIVGETGDAHLDAMLGFLNMLAGNR